MRVQQINNRQNQNFGAIKLPAPLRRSSALRIAIQDILTTDRDVRIRSRFERIDRDSWGFVEYLMTKYKSTKENLHQAKLKVHDSTITAVDENRVFNPRIEQGVFLTGEEVLNPEYLV